MIENNFKIFAFRAVDEPLLCEKYIEGHVKVLTDFGIANITSNNNEWTTNPDIYCLGLLNFKNELVGGIRIQIANGKHPLPVETAIGYLDSKIYNLVHKYAKNGGIGELSGLWINNNLRGLGTGIYMVRAAIASSTQLYIKTMIGICGDVTLNMFKNVGFIVDYSLGNNGSFLYPNKDLIAYPVGILDAMSLKNAAEYDKKIMLELRNDLTTERFEIDTKKSVHIKYNIHYPNVIKVNYNKKTNSIV